MEAGAELLERYTLEGLIGEGGSAEVYRARDARTGRAVAVKLLYAGVPEADRRRFEREIRILSSLTHPGVVEVLDLGEHSGRLFFVMPLLTGGPLTVLGPLEDEPELLGRFCTAAAFVARTLGYVHGRGVIHRDLTPGNILLGDDGLPRVMDFGLVSLGEMTRHLTRSGVTPGTPHYMAPEQAKGGAVGPWSDLYALGAVLYRVACGRPPFAGEHDQAVLYQHVYETPPHPQELNGAIPDALAALILALLEKDPAQRPAGGERVAQLLDEVREAVWRQAGGQYRAGRGRAGQHPGGPLHPPGLAERWSLALGGEVSWPAAVTAGRDLIAVGTRARTLALLDRSGGLHARLKADDEVTAPATVEDDGVVFGAWDGSLRRVDFAGRELWRHRTRAEITGAPTRWQESYLVGSRDGHLHSVGRERGELRWAYRAEGAVAASPLVWGGSVYLADEGGWLSALDAATGASLWRVQLDAVHATPALVPGPPGEATLLIPTWGGELHALHLVLQEGRYRPHPQEPLRWTFDVEDELWASPAAFEGRVLVAGWGGKLSALSLEGADELWSHTCEGRLTASPLISNGAVYLASEAGELLALDAATGAELWSRRFPVGVQATPLVSGGALYVAFMDGMLRAFR